MLDELLIRDLGIIDEVSLRLAPGLNVLTGETGAGKTMVVSGVQLLLGARADADRVRAGATAALVEGRLHPAADPDLGWTGEGEELVVSREVADEAAGTRSRARIGGRLAPVSALAEVMGSLVELHGQSDTARLATPAVQRALLDDSGGEGLARALADYRDAFQAWRAAEDELAALQSEARDRARELDRLRFELGEIDAVAPDAEEDDGLDEQIAILEHAEALIEAARNAASALTADGGARDALGACVAALRTVGGVDPALDELRNRSEGLAAEVQDLGLELTARAGGVELDPARLEALRERRAALAGLTRKYGPDVAAVIAYADDARARVEQLAGGEQRASSLAAEVETLRARVESAASRVTAARSASGDRLAAEVAAHLADLAMPEARLVVAVEPTDPGPDGADRITFLLAANPGEAPLPLTKAASGGERSRVALAVRLALADADRTPVLVFDEIDAGIGGQVAQQVGRKLARLARGRQVLCVTHLAQLAAFADAHFAVTKATDAHGRTVAGVRLLDEPERITELSRMLSGSPDSELAAGHAAELRQAALAARSGG